MASGVGQRIRTRRQQLGLSQQELAQRIGKGVHPSTIHNWESGKHAPTRHEGALELALGISLRDEDPPASYANPDDPYEVRIWSWEELPVETRRRAIDVLREAKREAERPRRRDSA